MNVFLTAGFIAICVFTSLQGLMKLDENHGMQFSGREWSVLLVGSVIAAGIWNVTIADETGIVMFGWLLIHIYFLSCAMTDSMTCQVYDLFQYLGIGAAGCLVLRNQGNIIVGISILLFAVFQYFIFMRLYGNADGMAFLVAAMALGSLGYNINMYLIHMIAAYLFLSLMQGIKGNINRKGRLIKPVPFLPYIMVSFWWLLLFGERINEYI